jgi:hypothetical protein
MLPKKWRINILSILLLKKGNNSSFGVLDDEG